MSVRDEVLAAAIAEIFTCPACGGQKFTLKSDGRFMFAFAVGRITRYEFKEAVFGGTITCTTTTLGKRCRNVTDVAGLPQEALTALFQTVDDQLRAVHPHRRSR